MGKSYISHWQHRQVLYHIESWASVTLHIASWASASCYFTSWASAIFHSAPSLVASEHRHCTECPDCTVSVPFFLVFYCQWCLHRFYTAPTDSAQIRYNQIKLLLYAVRMENHCTAFAPQPHIGAHSVQHQISSNGIPLWWRLFAPFLHRI